MGQHSRIKPRIAITLGDPAGIGPEIVCRVFARPDRDRYGHFSVIGDLGVVRKTVQDLKLPLQPVTVAAAAAPQGKTRILPVWDRHQVKLSRLRPGQVSALGGRASYHYITKGIALARDGRVDALVTAPINKAALHAAGYPYDGHTQILAEQCGVKKYAMLMTGKKLRVMLVTTHCALQRVARQVSRARVFQTIQLAQQALLELGITRGRIGVLGLNPHNGEQGIFGQEEMACIIPAIQQAQGSGMPVDGPLVPDVAFRPDKRVQYDMFVCMYHDQGLIPFKLLEFKTGVNMTVGLPIIRTSVDHGTAYDIAGKGRADSTSLWEACKLAARLARKRLKE